MSTLRRCGWVLLLVVAAVGCALMPSGCSKAKDPWEGHEGELKVVVSFPPLYSFTKNIAGPDAAVSCLLKAQGPHDYQPATQDILPLRKANLFLINGLGLDDGFAKKLQNNAGNDQLRMIEIAEDGIPREQLHKYSQADKDELGHVHGNYDPHVWLGLPEARLMVTHIRDRLAEADPQHKQGYQERAAAYLKRLDDLEAFGKQAFGKQKKEPFIAFHDSFRYFARTFDLTIAGVVEPQPGSESNQAEMAKLVQLCKKQNVRLIAVEPQYQQRSAGTLLRELQTREVQNAKPIVLDPLETAEPADLEKADWYERKMKENINHLASAFDDQR